MKGALYASKGLGARHSSIWVLHLAHPGPRSHNRQPILSFKAMTNPCGHDYQHQRKRQFWNDHGRPDRNRDSAGRGDRVTRQWGGWGDSWGEDALEAAW